MSETINPELKQKAGLFLLKLETETAAIGAPTLHLSLGIDTVNEKATGVSEVTQALAQPVVNTSHVSGPVIYETVMGPGSKIRLDLDGYPIIHWPSGGGVGPVIPKNFTATVLLDSDWQTGEVRYQYLDQNGQWIHIYSQQINAVHAPATQVAAE